MTFPRVFLLSPANSSGERARLLMNSAAHFDLAVKLRRHGAPVGELYAFVSGLYFRGKLAYAQAFADPPEGLPESLVITPGRGLISPETRLTCDEFVKLAGIPIDLTEPRYLAPLVEHAAILKEVGGLDCRFVLLGSVASAKYVAPLVEIFGEQLLFPADFVGRGDMSRGGLMLRCARAGVELSYVPVKGARVHGPRPPKLPRLR